jgi:hypothetical protein
MAVTHEDAPSMPLWRMRAAWASGDGAAAGVSWPGLVVAASAPARPTGFGRRWACGREKEAVAGCVGEGEPTGPLIHLQSQDRPTSIQLGFGTDLSYPSAISNHFHMRHLGR